MSSKRGRKRNDNLPPNRARDVQRAFRARRAAHLEALECRVQVLEDENSRLRQALDLPPSDRSPLGTGPTGRGNGTCFSARGSLSLFDSDPVGISPSLSDSPSCTPSPVSTSSLRIVDQLHPLSWSDQMVWDGSQSSQRARSSGGGDLISSPADTLAYPVRTSSPSSWEPKSLGLTFSSPEARHAPPIPVSSTITYHQDEIAPYHVSHSFSEHPNRYRDEPMYTYAPPAQMSSTPQYNMSGGDIGMHSAVPKREPYFNVALPSPQISTSHGMGHKRSTTEPHIRLYTRDLPGPYMASPPPGQSPMNALRISSPPLAPHGTARIHS